MDDILAIIFIFGGGTLVLLSFSPIGKAFADRVRHGKLPRAPQVDDALYDEVERLRGDMTEMQERVDFTERMIASHGGSVVPPAADHGGQP